MERLQSTSVVKGLFLWFNLHLCNKFLEVKNVLNPRAAGIYGFKHVLYQ